MTVYRVDTKRCTGCAGCVSVCASRAISISRRSLENSLDTAYTQPDVPDLFEARIDMSHCVRCGNCFAFCPLGAVQETSGDA